MGPRHGGTAGKWRDVAASPVLGVWWAACVVNSVLQYSPLPVLFGQRRLADISQFDTGLVVYLREFFWGRLISDVVGIAVSVLTVVVVVCITNLQERRRTAVNELATRQVATIV